MGYDTKCESCIYCKVLMVRKDGEIVVVCEKLGRIVGRVIHCEDYYEEDEPD